MVVIDTAVTYHSWREELFIRPFARMKTVKMSFIDALILNLAEQTPGARCFVTWNARHFQDKSTLPVMTPAAYLMLAQQAMPRRRKRPPIPVRPPLPAD